MTIVTIDPSGHYSAEAHGHPNDCTEPAPGQVQKSSDHSVTVTNANGETKQVATIASADMFFPSHAHDYDTKNGCHDNQSHTLGPDQGSSSLTINGSPVYVVENAVTTDPGSGGDVDLIDGGINESMT